MNKLIIDGQEFEIKHLYGAPNIFNEPQISFQGKLFIGKTIQKEKPKDYEILSFARINENNETWKRVDDKFRNIKTGGYGWTEEQLLNDTCGYSVAMGGSVIYSVKRLSDGEVFTVGDLITGYSYTDGRSIININKYPSGKIYFTQSKGETVLADANKKIKIFTTADGKDIYEGDEYWFIYPQYEVGKVEKANGDMNGALATISTKEAAEEYIFQNKPILSLKDVMDAMVMPIQPMTYLQEIVKLRLK